MLDNISSGKDCEVAQKNYPSRMNLVFLLALLLTCPPKHDSTKNGFRNSMSWACRSACFHTWVQGNLQASQDVRVSPSRSCRRLYELFLSARSVFPLSLAQYAKFLPTKNFLCLENRHLVVPMLIVYIRRRSWDCWPSGLA